MTFKEISYNVYVVLHNPIDQFKIIVQHYVRFKSLRKIKFKRHELATKFDWIQRLGRRESSWKRWCGGAWEDSHLQVRKITRVLCFSYRLSSFWDSILTTLAERPLNTTFAILTVTDPSMDKNLLEMFQRDPQLGPLLGALQIAWKAWSSMPIWPESMNCFMIALHMLTFPSQTLRCSGILFCGQHWLLHRSRQICNCISSWWTTNVDFVPPRQGFWNKALLRWSLEAYEKPLHIDFVLLYHPGISNKKDQIISSLSASPRLFELLLALCNVCINE